LFENLDGDGNGVNLSRSSEIGEVKGLAIRLKRFCGRFTEEEVILMDTGPIVAFLTATINTIPFA
jgi:hypothetical protein